MERKELSPYFPNGLKNICYNCPYSWWDEDAEYPTCHCNDSTDAPCNYDDEGNYSPC